MGGIVPRTDIRQTNMEMMLGPRPGRLGIRQIEFGAALDYISNLDNLLQTRQIDFKPLVLRFDSGDSLNTSITSQYELLQEDFRIHPDYKSPAGGYRFNWYTTSLRSAQRRNIWASIGSRWGGFYHGRRTDYTVSAGYKVAVPLYLEAAYERNRVHLPDGSFTVNISRFNANILFSPDMTLYSFLQYDNQSRNLGWQSRFYWILKPGNEIILVWNSSWIDPLESRQLGDSTLRFKINYNFRF